MKAIKIQDKKYYPQGEWKCIAERHEWDKFDDDSIYHYVEDGTLKDIKVGDIILLDEEFKVLEIEE